MASGSWYLLVIAGSSNIEITNNHFTGGITYGIFITPTIKVINEYYEFLNQLLKNPLTVENISQNIKVERNYLSLNRFGLAATKVNDLNVKNNFFIQKFSNAKNRMHWTDNKILIRDGTQVIWENNLYKEAYDQSNLSTPYLEKKFVPFPEIGGVNLS